jgi:hypothetical protein
MQAILTQNLISGKFLLGELSAIMPYQGKAMLKLGIFIQAKDRDIASRTER